MKAARSRALSLVRAQLSEVQVASICVDLVPDPRAGYFETLRRVRETYREFEKAGRKPSAYMFDWLKLFSPIEAQAWSSIRAYGVPLLPQYPVGPYYADFADPEKKIVLECDGKKFHSDVERDSRRDEFMADAGWTVFRVSGRECNAPEIDWEEVSYLKQDGDESQAEAMVRDWIMRSADGLLLAIAARFYGRRTGVDHDLITAALMHHCTTNLATWSAI